MGMTTKKRKSQSSAKSFLICGDEELVQEYGALFSQSEADVYIWHNRKPQLPKRKNFIYTRTLSRVPKKIIAAFELSNLSYERKIGNIIKIENHCAKESLIISSSVTQTVTAQTAHLQYPHRIIGLGAFPSLLQNDLVELCRGPFTQNDALKTVGDIFFDFKKEVSLVDDRVGMVMPRILCCLINEATFALQEEVASTEGIDTAMKLGTNYPQGPVEWGEKIGFDHVLSIMDALYFDTGEERYRPSPLLRKLAAGADFASRFLP